MSEEKTVKKQSAKNMLLNLLRFSIIFYVLGMSIYGQFKNSLYISADTELSKFTREERLKGEERKNNW